MSKRRDALKEYFAPVPPDPIAGTGAKPKQTGSIRAMGLSLAAMAEDLSELQTLRDQVSTSGATIIEVDPHLIDGSFIRDRIGSSLPDLADLASSIEADGQQVPVLLRRSKSNPARYEAAYGHRRIAACSALGLPVKALVKELSDRDLVIAQGKENLERQDLSFIERALFAARLEERGFDRATLTAALGVHKGNLSTMISLVKRLSADLIVQVGPAPKIGRPRWEALANALDQHENRASLPRLLAEEVFVNSDSNKRFELLNQATKRPATNKSKTELVQLRRSGNQVSLILDGRRHAKFAEFVARKMPELLAEFEANTATTERR